MYWLSYNYASATVLDSVWYTDYDDIRDFDQLFLGDEAMSPDRRRIAVAFRNMNQIILYDSKMQNFRWLTTDNELPLLNSSESFGENYSGEIFRAKTATGLLLNQRNDRTHDLFIARTPPKFFLNNSFFSVLF